MEPIAHTSCSGEEVNNIKDWVLYCSTVHFDLRSWLPTCLQCGPLLGVEIKPMTKPVYLIEQKPANGNFDSSPGRIELIIEVWLFDGVMVNRVARSVCGSAAAG